MVSLKKWANQYRMKKAKYILHRREEYQIEPSLHTRIHDLLKRCFSEYPAGRSYYQQVPTFRHLVYDQQRLVGHLAIEYRMINLAGAIVPIFGISDFCVDPDYQSQHIATDLLERVEAEARDRHIDFIILATTEQSFYEKRGYQHSDNPCRWLLLTRQQTLGVAQRRIERGIMVKATGNQPWMEGLLDFLGPMF